MTDGQKVDIFIDGIGELATIYDAKTDEFVCEAGLRVSRSWIESVDYGMNGILVDDLPEFAKTRSTEEYLNKVRRDG